MKIEVRLKENQLLRYYLYLQKNPNPKYVDDILHIHNLIIKHIFNFNWQQQM